MSNEANTCRKYVEPRLKDAGWETDPHNYEEQYYFTDGKIHPDLRNLKSKTGRERADVIAKVFKGVNNRMITGELLWDVLEKVNDIHFDRSNEYAWKYDFRSAYDQAIAEATPHWDAAKEADARASECKRQAKELEEKLAIQDLPLLKDPKTVKSLKQELKQLRQEEKQQLERTKEEQAKGDTIYWLIYNLDQKNPNSQKEFEHLPPEQLLADILEKDRRVAEIMTEIKSILED